MSKKKKRRKVTFVTHMETTKEPFSMLLILYRRSE
jgi:hypothetical protein